jgi:protoporphyrinogen oxidase
VNRQTRIYYRERFFDYPLKLLNVLKNLPLTDITLVLLSYVKQKIFPIKNPKNFEEWVVDRFGRRLFEIFFKNYTEKLWGIKCTEIDADWAAQRIKTLTLKEAVIAAIIGNRNNKHKTLVDQFAYPKNGTGALYEKAVDLILKQGGRLYLNTPIKKVIIENKKVKAIELSNGEIKKASVVVSTMPLTTLVMGLNDVPSDVIEACKKLFYRNTILVYLEIDNENLFSDNWIYVHAPNVKHGRITNFRNWCPSLNRDKKTSIVCMEYWCFDNDSEWKAKDEDLISLAKEEILKIKLVPKSAKILNGMVVRIPKCYPVYKTGYKEYLNVIINYLNEIEVLYPIGRYGAFKYNNQDHSILMGLLVAKKILENHPVDLWAINTDTEYQEDAKVKDVLIQ